MAILEMKPAGRRQRYLVAVAVAALASAPATAVLAQTALPEFPITAVGPEYNPDLPNIIVLDTGGTITASAQTRISYLNYGGDNGPANGLLTVVEDLYPELAEIANLSVVNLAANGYNIGSSGGLTIEKLYVISRTIDAFLADPEVDGLVLTAGTNVLEEDAYFFDLTIQSPKPVVLTGAMHQYGTFTYDGYTNLFSSIRLAASGGTTCFGTVVLLNDQFFASRDVTKTDGYRMDTFDARLYGPLGVVNQDNIRVMRAPSRVQDCGTDAWATPFDLSTIAPEDMPPVDLLWTHIQATPGPIDGAVANGAAGIVIAGHGPGGISALQNGARDAALEAGVVIVGTSRTGGEGAYETGGTLINAADLAPLKARMLLQIALGFTDDPEQVREWFATIGTAEFEPYTFE
ncbi:MAG: asparaginase [Bauldia sp.]|nr:asparaginase [Bauldia sp.]MCW5716995.1 asparaginase [Bauldia sp.]